MNRQEWRGGASPSIPTNIEIKLEGILQEGFISIVFNKIFCSKCTI
ncbi:MAG: hypothetical protein LC122_11640 [Chitinophagales bacterium]|nr:hypothetical protein [Chitinophagales bacterium]